MPLRHASLTARRLTPPPPCQTAPATPFSLALLQPAAHQQTLRRSITVGGVGLHTGEFAVVRVLPAFAGEGRYFVRVAGGTNGHLWEAEQPIVREVEGESRRHALPAAAEASAMQHRGWGGRFILGIVSWAAAAPDTAAGVAWPACLPGLQRWAAMRHPRPALRRMT